MKPKYSVGDTVTFKIDGVERVTIIECIEPYEQQTEHASWDYLCKPIDGGPKLCGCSIGEDCGGSAGWYLEEDIKL